MYNFLRVDRTAFAENLWTSYALALKAKGKNQMLKEACRAGNSPKEKIRAVALRGHSKEVIPVLKCDAYGLGASELAHCCKECGVTRIAVVRTGEATALKEAGLEILILNAIPKEELEEAIQGGYILTVYTSEQINSLDKLSCRMKKNVRVHLKMNTGMNRFGADEEELLPLLTQISQAEYLTLEGLFSHYHNAYDKDPLYTEKQFERFLGITDTARKQGFTNLNLHLGNSAALMGYPSFITGSSRPGIMLYGSYPSYEMYRNFAGEKGLKPVASLHSKVLQIRHLREGDYIGYGSDWKVTKPCRVAVIPIGYGDGFPRSAADPHKEKQQTVLIGEDECPFAGNVCMDSLTVKLPEHAEIETGNEVTLFGGVAKGALSVDERAESFGIIPYELLTGINQRVYRHYTGKI